VLMHNSKAPAVN